MVPPRARMPLTAFQIERSVASVEQPRVAVLEAEHLSSP